MLDNAMDGIADRLAQRIGGERSESAGESAGATVRPALDRPPRASRKPASRGMAPKVTSMRQAHSISAIPGAPRDGWRAVSCVAACALSLMAVATAVAQPPTRGEVVDLMRLTPGANARVASWVDEQCGAAAGDACADILGDALIVRWGRLGTVADPSAIAIFSTGNTLGSTGVAVVARAATGEGVLSMPLTGRVFSARAIGGRLRVVQDMACTRAGERGTTFGYLRIRWYALRDGTLRAVGQRPRC